MESSPTLTNLPSELLDLIIASIPSIPDLKSLRLTCRAFNTHAIPYLFKDITLHLYGFSSNVPSKRLEEFAQLVQKYGHCVHSLDVSGNTLDASCPIEVMCPYEIVPLLDQMPRLQTLKLHGELFPLPCRVEVFDDVVHRASLLTPPAERILTNLRSLTHEVYHPADGDIFLEKLAPIFIIPSLTELHLTDLILSPTDLQIPYTFFQGIQHEFPKTNLRTLSIRDSYIDITAIKNMLAFPRALRQLNLQSRDPENLPDGWSEEKRTLADLVAALEQQRESLEVLMLRDLPLDESGGELDLSRFPRLREYSAVYKDCSGRFKAFSG